jgi:phage recombination protein Bet
MANEVAKVEVSQGLTFTPEQVALIKSQVAPDASNDELAVFLHVAKKAGLDPLSRQIYCIHRNAKNSQGGWTKRMTIQTAIDGFRVIAERSGDYAGQGEPVFVVDKDGRPKVAKVSIFRFDARGNRYEASVGVAYWDEYVQTDKEGNAFGLWKKMPHTMLAKVAEALGLRKAYPHDLSGIYTAEEMNQADNTVDTKYSVEVTSDKSVDELKKEYLERLAEYEALTGEDTTKFHPDNWKGEQTIKNFVLALSALDQKITEAKSQTKK